MIKEYKTWKINNVVDASDGFAKNFLIKKGYAISYNEKNKSDLKIKLSKIKKQKARDNEALEIIKNQLEKIVLNFSLKVSNENIIGSISTKSVSKKLSELNIKIPKHALENIHIKFIGITYINIKLNKEINAKLKIEVVGENV